MQQALFDTPNALTKPSHKIRNTTALLYQRVREEHKKMMATEYKGCKMYNPDFVYIKLGEKFFKSPKTIENIVFNRC